jgi:tRNA nucleotidyltransferase (CCA-adding enzyme)
MLLAGFKQVGANFPVFLHPQTGDEYALARTEKSTGTRYKDFDVYFGEDVTLEQDLARRDLTINSMAKDLETGEIIDPFNGQEDIANKVLRATSEAFLEDPVRALRLFRFQATLGRDWRVDVKTYKMAETLLANPDAFTGERVWKELEKVFKYGQFFFIFLWALGKICKPIEDLYKTPQNPVHHPEGVVGVHTALSVECDMSSDTEVPFAIMCHDLGKPVAYRRDGTALGHEELAEPIINRISDWLGVSRKHKELAILVAKHHTKIHGILGRGNNKPTKPKSIMKLFEETQALNKPDRFEQILRCCYADANGRGFEVQYPQYHYLLDCLKAARLVDNKQIAGELLALGKDGMFIGEAIRSARIKGIRRVYDLGN